MTAFHKKLREQLGKLRGENASPTLPQCSGEDREDVSKLGFVIVSRNGTCVDDVSD